MTRLKKARWSDPKKFSQTEAIKRACASEIGPELSHTSNHTLTLSPRSPPVDMQTARGGKTESMSKSERARPSMNKRESWRRGKARQTLPVSFLHLREAGTPNRYKTQWSWRLLRDGSSRLWCTPLQIHPQNIFTPLKDWWLVVCLIRECFSVIQLSFPQGILTQVIL